MGRMSIFNSPLLLGFDHIERVLHPERVPTRKEVPTFENGLLAEDLTSETFLRALRRISSASPWKLSRSRLACQSMKSQSPRVATSEYE
jgi:hypothetical protein